VIFTDQEVADGLKRLARSPDAKFLRQLLLQVQLSTGGDMSSLGALAHEQGRRTLAQQLMSAITFAQEPDERVSPEPNAAELAARSGGSRRVSTGGIRRRVPDDADEG